MELLVLRSGVIGIGVLACALDVRTRRIPNALTLTGAAAGFLVHGLTGGLSGIGSSAAGFGLGILLFLPWFALGGMGGGDVKLLAAFGAWLGPLGALWTALYAGVAGGVIAGVVALTHGYLRQAFRNIGGMIWLWSITGPAPVPHLTLEEGTAPRLAYALPVTVGALVSLWLR